MKNINILVLGVGGNVSQGIVKAIRMSNLNCKILGACVSEDAPGLYMCDKAYISPYASSIDFIEWLIKICNSEKIDLIMTGVEEIIFTIAKNITDIEKKTNAIFVSSTLEKLRIGQDKLLTCEWLKKNGLNYPEFVPSKNFKLAESLFLYKGFPLIGKPRDGKGSNGIMIINNIEELKAVSDLDNYVIQEYIGNESSEYTIGCYCDIKGNLVDIIIMHRILKQGTTHKATVVYDEVIYNEAKKICELFKPTGPLNIQLRLDKESRPVCFELNVRFSGTTPMRAKFGYRDVEAQIYEYILNKDIQNLFNIKTGTAYRYLDEVYKMDSDNVTINK